MSILIISFITIFKLASLIVSDNLLRSISSFDYEGNLYINILTSCLWLLILSASTISFFYSYSNSWRVRLYLFASDAVEHLLKAVVCPLLSSFFAIRSSFHITKYKPSFCPEFFAVIGLPRSESSELGILSLILLFFLANETSNLVSFKFSL